MDTFYLVTHHSVHVPTRPSRAKTDICLYRIIFSFQRVYMSTKSEIKYLEVPCTWPGTWQILSNVPTFLSLSLPWVLAWILESLRNVTDSCQKGSS